jgi:hypothetical protein
MRELNSQEIETVGGGFGLIGAGVGAAIGGGSYVAGALWAQQSINPGAFMMSTALGAVSGFTGGAAGIAASAGRTGAAAGLYSASVISGIGSGSVAPLTTPGIGGPAPASASAMGQGGGSE